jgi:Ran GTPase-activating protein (RanGAP) involved in mRNA processing and transport
MMDELEDKHITHLDLSHNAFGPDGIKSFETFLQNASYLTHLDVSNCGLSPRGGVMIAEALLRNRQMKLTSFAATRSRLEEDGIAALSHVFAQQQSIEVLNLAQNGSKRALGKLLDAMIECKHTLRELRIEDNKSINRATK